MTQIVRYMIDGFVVEAPVDRDYDQSAPFYIKARQLWYPPIIEQLDMQHKGTWHDYINSVKLRIPKHMEPQDIILDPTEKV
jgi:hypothetical protein